MIKRLLGVTLVSVTVLAVGISAPVTADAAPAGPLPAGPLPAGPLPAGPASGLRPGTVVHTSPVPAANLLDGAGQAWKVRYLSTSWSGRRTEVSGTITVPRGPAPHGGRPVVTFGSAFQGTADSCAKSLSGPSPTERLMQEALLRAGYVVAVTDFEGIGTPGPASMGHGKASAEALIDIVRATRQLSHASRDWAAVGYSLGGQAALFSGAIAGEYAPELRARGVVGLAALGQWEYLFRGGAAADLPVSPPAPYWMQTWDDTYGGRDFHAADWLTPRGLALTRATRTTCIANLIPDLGTITNAEFYRDPAAVAEKQVALLAEQEIPIADYGIPVRLAHGTLPAPVPWVVSQRTAAQLAAAGTDAQFLPVEGVDHNGLMPAIAPTVIGWLDGFFAAKSESR